MAELRYWAVFQAGPMDFESSTVYMTSGSVATKSMLAIGHLPERMSERYAACSSFSICMSIPTSLRFAWKIWFCKLMLVLGIEPYLIENFLPSLTRIPSLPAFQPASVSNCLALFTSYAATVFAASFEYPNRLGVMMLSATEPMLPKAVISTCDLLIAKATACRDLTSLKGHVDVL